MKGCHLPSAILQGLCLEVRSQALALRCSQSWVKSCRYARQIVIRSVSCRRSPTNKHPAPRRKPGPRKLEMVCEILHAHFSDCPALSELAKIAAIHPTYLSRSFRARFGCTISSYVQQQTEFAWQRLVDTDETVSNIALRVGFAHQAHFSTAFKRQTVKTPAEVRKLQERHGRTANFA